MLEERNFSGMSCPEVRTFLKEKENDLCKENERIYTIIAKHV